MTTSYQLDGVASDKSVLMDLGSPFAGQKSGRDRYAGCSATVA